MREGHVGGVMGAYNSVYGLAVLRQSAFCSRICCADNGDLTVTSLSDCGAIHDIYGQPQFRAHARSGRGGRGEGRLRYLLRRRLQSAGARRCKQGLITGAGN